MASQTRRECGKTVFAGFPALAVAGRTLGASRRELLVGVSTFSFNDLRRVTGRDSVDLVIDALKAVGATRVELALSDVEPTPPNTSPFIGGSPAYPTRVVFTPEQIASINARARQDLREWRARTEPKYFDGVRGKFASANIALLGAAVSYNASFTDDELEATFRQAKALGVSTLASEMTMATAARLVPFMQRHGVTVAIHNQTADNTEGFITSDQLNDALALSPAFKVKLDVANVTASNRDAVAALRAHESRVAYVIVRDRLRNNGASQHLGEGDTPILDVLKTLKASEF